MTESLVTETLMTVSQQTKIPMTECQLGLKMT